MTDGITDGVTDGVTEGVTDGLTEGPGHNCVSELRADKPAGGCMGETGGVDTSPWNGDGHGPHISHQ